MDDLQSFLDYLRLNRNVSPHTVAAYQADLTRVATYVMAAEGTDRPYPHLKVSGGFHPVSHHANQRERIAEGERWGRITRMAAWQP